jgi:hypothetical protein
MSEEEKRIINKISNLKGRILFLQALSKHLRQENKNYCLTTGVTMNGKPIQRNKLIEAIENEDFKNNKYWTFLEIKLLSHKAYSNEYFRDFKFILTFSFDFSVHRDYYGHHFQYNLKPALVFTDFEEDLYDKIMLLDAELEADLANGKYLVNGKQKFSDDLLSAWTFEIKQILIKNFRHKIENWSYE